MVLKLVDAYQGCNISQSSKSWPVQRSCKLNEKITEINMQKTNFILMEARAYCSVCMKDLAFWQADQQTGWLIRLTDQPANRLANQRIQLTRRSANPTIRPTDPTDQPIDKQLTSITGPPISYYWLKIGHTIGWVAWNFIIAYIRHGYPS